MLIFPIFQSTLPREERPSTSWIRQSTTRFQSTLPREERRNGTFTIGALIAISIHAPTRGATRTISQVSVFIVFQSTLPREERPLWVSILYSVPNFNPRSHERSDAWCFRQSFTHIHISIHAPTRGATLPILPYLS